MLTAWSKTIILPIPKGGMKNIYILTNYRGLSLLCTLSKCYTGILNNCLDKFLTDKNYIVEEQAGFRKGYACVDQAYILHSIIKDILSNKKSLFCVFIDLEKCFDWINHNLLFLKLSKLEICGKLYHAIQSVLRNSECCVKLNNLFTKWFNVSNSLKQGDTFSPKLASFYLNDLATDINMAGRGAKLEPDLKVSILMHADDLVLLSNTKENLQKLLKNIPGLVL